MHQRRYLSGGRVDRKPYGGITGVAAACLGLSLLVGFFGCAGSGPPVNEARHKKIQDDAAAALMPAGTFFREPLKKAFSISPDGSHVAWLAPWNKHMNLYVASVLSMGTDTVSTSSDGTLIDGSKENRRITNILNEDVNSYYWIDNDNIVFLSDVGGDGNFNLYLVPKTGGVVLNLTPFPGVRVEVLDAERYRPDEILIVMNQRDPVLFDAYRLRISTGQLRRIAENSGNIVRWMADHDGNLRAAVQTDGLRTVLLYRDLETDAFRPVFSADALTRVSLHGFTFDNRHLLLVTNAGRDKDALVVFDPIAGKEVQQIYANPDVDVLAPLLSRHRRRVEGAVYITDRVRYAFFDEERKAVQAAIDGRFPGLQASIAGRSREEKRLLILVSGDRQPGGYYALDVESSRMEKLADLRPWIDPIRLADAKPVEYSARDGQRIHGYLTLPSGKPPRNLPVVVLPHSDTWARDIWGYHPEAQFLASRGYGVFQPNFRGSSGYGRAFQVAGFRQWGIGVMQNDISDGVAWLIAEGIADPGRIAICGVSYGGYAALAGLTFTPALYAAGVSQAGPANLFTLIQSFPSYRKTELERVYMEIGDPRKESRRLIGASPYFHVDRIRAPLFLAQSETDPRVKKSEIDEMVYRLRRRGIHVPYMVWSNEGHGFQDPANQVDFYRGVEAFLARHLGGRTATPAAVLGPLEQAY